MILQGTYTQLISYIIAFNLYSENNKRIDQEQNHICAYIECTSVFFRQVTYENNVKEKLAVMWWIPLLNRMDECECKCVWKELKFSDSMTSKNCIVTHDCNVMLISRF